MEFCTYPKCGGSIALIGPMTLRYQCWRLRNIQTIRRGTAGMKATKTELIRLARLVQKDIAGGRVSKNTQRSLEMLAAYQNSAIELLDLALEEAREGAIRQAPS